MEGGFTDRQQPQVAEQYPYPTTSSRNSSSTIESSSEAAMPLTTSFVQSDEVESFPTSEDRPSMSLETAILTTPATSFTSTSGSTSAALRTTASLAMYRSPVQTSLPSQTSFETSIFYSASIQPSPTPTALKSVHLSATTLAVLFCLAGFLLLIFLTFLIFCFYRKLRNQRRKRNNTLNEPISSEKGTWGSDDSDAFTADKRSPSTILGGKERTGLTPNPSWATFPDGNANGNGNGHTSIGVAPSPYPLGLLPPPMAVQRSSSMKGQNGVGLGLAQSRYPSSPPVIAIASSSNTSSTHALTQPTLHRTALAQHGTASSSSSSTLATESINRVSLYDNTVHGKQLTDLPQLPLENSACKGNKASGWRSQHDSVDVEFGVKTDQKHPAAKRRSRLLASGRVLGLWTARMTAPEVSDTSYSNENVGRNSLRPHPHPPARVQHASFVKSPHNFRNPTQNVKYHSPRVAKLKPALLYDLPRFDNLGPNIGGATVSRRDSLKSMNDYSLAASIPSPIAAVPHFREGKQREMRSDRCSRRGLQQSPRVTSGHPQQPDASPTWSEMYAYFYASGEEEGEEEEVAQIIHPRISHTSQKPSPKQGSHGFQHGIPATRWDDWNPKATAGSGAHASVEASTTMSCEEKDELEPSVSDAPNSNVKEEEGSDGVGAERGVSVPDGKNLPLPSRSNRRYQRGSLANPKAPSDVYHSTPPRTRATTQPQYCNVRSAPPSLRQLRLLEECPDYMSPTEGAVREVLGRKL